MPVTPSVFCTVMAVMALVARDFYFFITGNDVTEETPYPVKGVDVSSYQLEIDWQGARQIRRLFPETVSVFILPPSIAVLEDRLKKRGQDSPEIIRQRIEAADEEIRHACEADYVIINTDFDLALSKLASIVEAARCRTALQAIRNRELFLQFGIVQPDHH